MKVCTDAVWLCWIEAHPGLASWIQAVFSIIAIVAAFLAPWVMEVAKERIRQRRLRRVAVEAMALASAAAKTFADAMADPELRKSFGENPEGYPHYIFEEARSALSAVNGPEIDNFHLKQALQTFRVQFAGMATDLDYMRDFSDDDEMSRDWATSVRKRADAIRQVFDEARALA